MDDDMIRVAGGQLARTGKFENFPGVLAELVKTNPGAASAFGDNDITLINSLCTLHWKPPHA